jgi:hypothetical protein
LRPFIGTIGEIGIIRQGFLPESGGENVETANHKAPERYLTAASGAETNPERQDSPKQKEKEGARASWWTMNGLRRISGKLKITA